MTDRKKIRYFYRGVEEYEKQEGQVKEIIQKDTGEHVWMENMSLPPIGYPPPLTTESIEKLKGLEGVMVDEVDNND
ncbi:hypothetical protein NM208_g5517 [Fusarium decemcellulare]|uniref:Uncharacterized protein n=1 Tax=Fusarium decemcellulare TaxID=57161 RepID=A0ACC1SGY0_9HYPO|nr:hypothetical protein NM208_g5517 [Fusarium decemcellulare]